MRWDVLVRRAGALLLTLLVGGFLGATLVRLGPGYGTDEQKLDPRLSGASIAALRQAHASEKALPAFYWGYLTGLLRERLPVTLAAVGTGLGAG
jgi:ABC-type dipeptide/oligopeptide/nickel transport system permease component